MLCLKFREVIYFKGYPSRDILLTTPQRPLLVPVHAEPSPFSHLSRIFGNSAFFAVESHPAGGQSEETFLKLTGDI